MMHNSMLIERSIRILNGLILLFDDTIDYHEGNEIVISKLKNEKDYIKRYLRVLNARENRKRVELAFAGRTSSGKSKLINALMGEDILPEGINPVSSYTVKLSHSLEKEYRITLRTTTSASPERDVYETSQQVCEAVRGYSYKASNIENILIESSSFKFLEELNCVLVDTPGFLAPGKVGKEHERKLEGYLLECHPILFWVTSPDPVRGEKDYYNNNLSNYVYDLVFSKADMYDKTNEREKLQSNTDSNAFSPEKLYNLRSSLKVPSYCLNHIVSAQKSESNNYDYRLVKFQGYLRNEFSDIGIRHSVEEILTTRLQDIEQHLLLKYPDEVVWSPMGRKRFLSYFKEEYSIEDGENLAAAMNMVKGKWTGI